MSLKVFLSGAIEGVEEYGIAWRKVATHSLHLAGYDVLDPTTIVDTGYETPEEIVEKNLFLQRRADLLLVEYMLPDRAYVGTDFELAWAKMNGQPAVVFCCDKNKTRVYLQYMATKLASSMQDAIEYLSTNYPSN
jgi:nucleoside 2-deoxyribosyltransferase